MSIRCCLALALLVTASSVSWADDLDVVCGSYRNNAAVQRERCQSVKLSLDRSACVKESVVPAEQAYSSCIRSFNERGARKTQERIEQGKKQRPQP